MIGKADHYGIVVSEMDRALEFYTETLGMDHTDSISQQDPAFSTAVDVDGTDVQLEFVDAGGFTIELVAFDAPPGRNVNPDIALNDTGAAHFCISVDDIQAVYEEIGEEADFISPPQDLETGVSLAFLTDPDGNVIELLEE